MQTVALVVSMACTVSKGLKAKSSVSPGWAKNANHHFDMRPHEHDSELISFGCIIWLGRTCPTLPCTDKGNETLEAASFKVNRESS